MFSEYCERRFEIEPVQVIDASGASAVYPEVTPRTLDVPVSMINGHLGLSLPASQVADLLTRMQLPASLSADGSTLSLSVPITRSDILHACDVVEDVAIAYGYNNLAKTVCAASVCISRKAALLLYTRK
jgi:phenylalanyl-tRNA synthetase beta chain